MGKFISTTFGYISGRHGTAVAAVTKDGKNILRVYKSPSNPNTPKQQAHRQKFGMANKSMAPLREIVKMGYNNSGAFRKAVSQTMREAIIESEEGPKIDFSNVMIAEGRLQDVLSASASRIENEDTLQIEWDTTIGFQSKMGKDDDLVQIVVFDEAIGFSLRFDNVAERSEGQAVVHIPAILKEKKLHVWLYLSDKENLHRSNSRYIAVG